MNHNHEVDSVKLDTRDYRVKCHQCGHEFEATRSDAAFCSARCRVACSREPARRASAIAGLKSSGSTARQIARKYRYSSDVYQAMLELRREIDAALATFE